MIYYMNKYIEELFCAQDQARNIVRIEKNLMSSAMKDTFLGNCYSDSSFFFKIPKYLN